MPRTVLHTVSGLNTIVPVAQGATGLAIALVPGVAHATTAFPPFFWFYLGSLFIVLPVLALAILVRVGLSWRHGLLGGEWVVAALAAAGTGVWALWAATNAPTPVLTGTNWPIIYLALVPLLAVWFRSWRLSSRGKDREVPFASDEEFFGAVRELIGKLEKKGHQGAAAMLREGFGCLNGLTDGWALFLKSIDGVLSAGSRGFDKADRQSLNVIRAAVNNAVSRR